LSEEAKKERATKAKATRLRHKMESLYSKYLVDLTIEEKTMWDQKPEKEKEATVLQWDRLKKNEKTQQSCSPNCHGNEKEDIEDVVETKNPRPKH
jgi:hypothetical protein